MKIIFLDIDGVLNSTKTCIAFGGYPNELEHKGAFDWVAIKLLQRLCDSEGIQIVLSSTWRRFYELKDIADALDLPIIDKTIYLGGDARGEEIKEWLIRHPDVEMYAIIDDDSDMLGDQLPFFVHTDGAEGFTWKNYGQLCRIFKTAPYVGEARDRNWRTPPMAWESS